MPVKSKIFRLGSSADRAKVVKSLASRCTMERDVGAPVETVFMDTFDWRIHHLGGALFLESSDSVRQLTWQTGPRGSSESLSIDEAPGFEWDLPDSEFRSRLAGIIEMRRLLPVAKVVSRRESFRILDSRRKTVARVHVESRRAGAPESRVCRRAMPSILVASGIRGYDEDLEDLFEFFGVELGLEIEADSELAAALAAVGLTPVEARSKITFDLEPKMPADSALRQILGRLLQTLEENEDGVRSGLDTEFLHDFRVSSRRTRSALTQLKGILPARAAGRFKREFAWLGQVTGPTRDLDVYLLKMPSYRKSLTSGVREDLEPLGVYLQGLQRQARSKMTRSLGTKRYAKLLSDWRTFLEKTTPVEDLAGLAGRPILEVARARTWKAYRRVLKGGSAIGADTPAEALHRLRIDCKKLRYLLEFFRSLFTPKDMAVLIKALRRLQDNLGDFNDYEVQQDALVTFARDMSDKGLAGAVPLMAMGRLVELLELGQERERQRFHKQFDRFAAKKNRQRFQRLFKSREAS